MIIFVDKKYYPVLRSVMGQLSDGIWENSRAMEKYWKNMGVMSGWLDGELKCCIRYEYWLFDNEEACKKFFANKIKQIVKEEGLAWKRDNETEAQYFYQGVTVKLAYEAYDYLLGRVR